MLIRTLMPRRQKTGSSLQVHSFSFACYIGQALGARTRIFIILRGIEIHNIMQMFSSIFFRFSWVNVALISLFTTNRTLFGTMS